MNRHAAAVRYRIGRRRGRCCDPKQKGSDPGHFGWPGSGEGGLIGTPPDSGSGSGLVGGCDAIFILLPGCRRVRVIKSPKR